VAEPVASPASAGTTPGVRVRFCPSPTGVPHVGLARTALFNWAFARHEHGTMVFRIEDTDPARDSEESYRMLVDVLRWLGLDWDEGPEVGGPYAPYRQSARLEVYADAARRLMQAGHAYECYCLPEELEARRAAARAAGRPSGYDGHCRALTTAQRAAYREEGRVPALRFRMPDRDVTFTDLIRGQVTVAADQLSDYVLVRAGGQPLYTLVNPVDDALMHITHVLRGEDLLSSTPRQLPLLEALVDVGVADADAPTVQYAHLPYVMGEGNRKLSKRDPESNLLAYRERGFLPEGLLNYLALLGWAIADDRDVFTMDEMVAAFDIRRVNPNPARFDPKKCEAINAAHVRRLGDGEFARRALPHLQAAGLVADPPDPAQLTLLERAAPLVRERVTTLGDVVGMVGFLLCEESAFAIEPQAFASLDEHAPAVLAAAARALGGVAGWGAGQIEQALRAALVDGLGLKPRVAFTPVRVAVTGRRVSPPLFESLELLGRERTLGRLAAAARAFSGDARGVTGAGDPGPDAAHAPGSLS
jgi:glutamyl-tRNA synthetase